MNALAQNVIHDYLMLEVAETQQEGARKFFMRLMNDNTLGMNAKERIAESFDSYFGTYLGRKPAQNPQTYRDLEEAI